MGRGVIHIPMDEVASFIVLPETAFLYDKYNVVSWWLVSTHKNSSSNIVVISIKVITVVVKVEVITFTNCDYIQ